MDDLKVLEGKVIQALIMDSDKVQIAFITDQGRYNFFCEADCCSESWINHVADIDVLLGHKVNEVESIDMFGLLQVTPEPTRQECDQVMFHRLHTDKGICVLEFRNSSNGYYGGWLTEQGNDFDGEPITEDF